MLTIQRRAEMPDRIAHGFLKASGLQAMNLGKVLCYQYEKYHTGFTLFSQDDQACVYVQMGDSLQLKIFPSDWTHAVSAQSPKRIVHLYRGPDFAVFIRYMEVAAGSAIHRIQ